MSSVAKLVITKSSFFNIIDSYVYLNICDNEDEFFYVGAIEQRIKFLKPPSLLFFFLSCSLKIADTECLRNSLELGICDNRMVSSPVNMTDI